MDEAVMDLKVAAARLGVSYDTAQRWAKAGILPAYHLAGRRKWSIDEDDLNLFISQSKTGPEVGPENHRTPSKMARNQRDHSKKQTRKGQWMEQYG